MSIGERIKRRREELEMSQDDLAKKLGYKSRSSITKIEKEGRELPQTKIKAIAEALSTTPAYILGWNEAEQRWDTDIEQERIETCNLFEECYGKDAYNVVSRFLKLDDEDRARVSERIDTLLEQDKYVEKRQEERSSAYEITAADA